MTQKYSSLLTIAHPCGCTNRAEVLTDAAGKVDTDAANWLRLTWDWCELHRLAAATLGELREAKAALQVMYDAHRSPVSGDAWKEAVATAERVLGLTR